MSRSCRGPSTARTPRRARGRSSHLPWPASTGHRRVDISGQIAFTVTPGPPVRAPPRGEPTAGLTRSSARCSVPFEARGQAIVITRPPRSLPAGANPGCRKTPSPTARTRFHSSSVIFRSGASSDAVVDLTSTWPSWRPLGARASHAGLVGDVARCGARGCPRARRSAATASPRPDSVPRGGPDLHRRERAAADPMPAPRR